MAKDIARTTAGEASETTRPGREVTPPVDIYENEQELLLVADLPGIDAGGLDIKLEPPELRIEGRRGSNDSTVTFTRAFRIGEAIDPDGISAELGSGVLKVHLKKSRALQPRKVEVRAN